MIIFEQHNGKDIKRVIQQMLQHCEHLESKLLKQQYKLTEDPQTCYVFEHEKLIEPVINRMQKESRILNQQHCFILNTQQNIERLGFNNNYL